MALAPESGLAEVAYPAKVIRLIVPAPSGGGVDALTRVVAQQLQTRLGQAIVIENRPGAGTTVGTEAVALAEPDGYTLLMAASNHMIAPVLYANLGYDPIKSFAPVAMVTTWSHLMVVRPGLQVKTVRELVDYAKANPGKVSFGFGIGTAPQIVGEYLKAVSGAEILSVPYRGSAQAVTDTIGDRIDIHISPVATMRPLVEQGKIKTLAFTGVKRSPLLPNVPTMIESGFPQIAFNPDAWLAILAPAGTPQAIVDKLNATVNESLRSPELLAAFARMGFDATPETTDTLAGFLVAEAKKWPPILEAAGVKGD